MSTTPIADLIAALAANGVPIESIILSVRAVEKTPAEVPKASADAQAMELQRRREKDKLRSRIRRKERRERSEAASADKSADGILQKKSPQTPKENLPYKTPNLFSGEEGLKLEDTRARPESDLAAAMEAYNAMARHAKLPECKKLNNARARALRQRLKDCGGLPGWSDAMRRVAASHYLTGKINGFRANIDFILQQSGFQKIIEGNYDTTTVSKPNYGDRIDAQFARIFEKSGPESGDGGDAEPAEGWIEGKFTVAAD